MKRDIVIVETNKVYTKVIPESNYYQWIETDEPKNIIVPIISITDSFALQGSKNYHLHSLVIQNKEVHNAIFIELENNKQKLRRYKEMTTWERIKFVFRMNNE